MKKTILFVGIGLAVIIIFVTALFYVWSLPYKNHISPNVWIGPVDIGGLDPQTARETLQTQIDSLVTNGIPIQINGISKPLALATLVSSDLNEEVTFDLDRAMQEAQAVPLVSSRLWNKKIIPLTVSVAKENLKKNISALFPSAEIPVQDARFLIVPTAVNNEWSVQVIEDRAGNELNWDPFFQTLETQLMNLDDSEIVLTVIEKTTSVTKQIAEQQVDQIKSILENDRIKIAYLDAYKTPRTFELTKWALSKMLIPTQSGKVGIDEAQFNLFLDDFAKTFERPAQDARFVIDNGRVIEFTESKSGIKIDRVVMFNLLSQAIQEPINAPIQLALIVEEPLVKTGDVNDLGIQEILGFGTSSYRGSPMNRRKNIQNGVRLLNGILIAPGQTFSLLDALKPFDQENGYLPELVIKGDKITPELGGGLCQIGTTTFRAAMNSGLPIVERQNHSLVVSYYNDPANGNPGTDATIYEPSPDFKFLNDTGNYILFQAENLTETQELRFTFWGTPDGRKGSYSAPAVLRWIPVAEPQKIETTDLKPGEEKCQDAHIGADASFVYTIVRPDGTVEETTFTSHYRPLPKICLIGIAPPPVIPSEAEGSFENIQ
ncbi:VanW family protein [Candidatus Uhrbacteria bacterium]|nr:VanW family protein [Candidatus Uhrbacteria bacterium]